MAISKERLEELINQGTTIYGIDDSWDIVEIRELDASQLYYSLSNNNFQYMFDDCGVVEFFEDDLFETEEDAKWHKEFKRIPRTDYLDLPTWEEFDGQKFVWFFDKDHKCCCLHYLNCSNKIFINVGGNVIEIGELTKENYTIACRKARELFLGENN